MHLGQVQSLVGSQVIQNDDSQIIASNSAECQVALNEK